MDPTLRQIVKVLNRKKQRATYGAVAQVIGGIAQGVGAKLGDRRPEVSWIVAAANGKPTGYLPAEIHPDLERTSYIIITGDELCELLRG